MVKTHDTGCSWLVKGQDNYWEVRERLMCYRLNVEIRELKNVTT